VIKMTPRQLEEKAKQLHSKRRLLEAVEQLEEGIKTFMTLERRTVIFTEKFTISLVEGRLDISVRTPIAPNQLTLNFKSQRKGGR
jgi:hypothetical protein